MAEDKADQIPQDVAIEPGDEPGEMQGPFFRRVDWIAFWITLLVSLAAYVLTLAPTVSLEDSGELVVAADYLGVPHPPGYPIWTLLAWLFQWVFHFVTYEGQPNRAWSVGFMSAFFGAVACATLALLVSRSGYDMLRAIPGAVTSLGSRATDCVVGGGGVAGGLLFAFSPVLWSQSVIVEVYSLNAFFLSIILLLTYRWMCRPHEDLMLYTAAFLFGLGLTNHQSLLFAVVGLVFAIAYRDLPLLRDCLAGGFWMIGVLLCYKAGSLHAENMPQDAIDNMRGMVTKASLITAYGWLYLLLHDDVRERFQQRIWTPFVTVIFHPISLVVFYLVDMVDENSARKRSIWQRPHIMGTRGVGGAALWALSLFIFFRMGVARSALSEESGAFGVVVFLLLGIGVSAGAIALLGRHIMTQWKRFVIVIGMVALGLSFYLYLPIASDQNPPMNWGYPRTEEGFWHALSRGQYEKISVMDNVEHAFAHPERPAEMFYKVVFSPTDFVSVIWQFTSPMIVLSILCYILIWRTRRRSITWFIVTVMMFCALSFLFLMFQYPDLDVQTLFIGRVQYIQCHAIYALWLSYGMILGLSWLSRHMHRHVPMGAISVILAVVLPSILVFRNAFTDNEDYRKLLGGVEQNGHDFGWQFGNYQLRGVEAIIEELDEGETPPPSTTFPPAMEQDAIFFGGTDPGRFVPTYMIYSAKVRPDVFLITQNALADNTYMNVMRDLYGDQIWIPAMSDSNQAFKKYVEDVRAGRIPAGAQVTEQGGRVSVQGVQGVMMINGILTKYIFDYNKHKHAFYIEESYVIPWMYPHLTPHGLILKINKDPLPRLSDDIVRNDHAFWTWYAGHLLADEKFRRDVVARKTFSKLRSAIGGLYVYRRMFDEAEYAFRQAIELYELSPEANFRLSDALLQQRKFDAAIETISAFLEKDPKNEKVRGYLNQLKRTSEHDKRRQELEPLLAKGADLNTALELLDIYKNMGQAAQFDNLAVRMVADERIPLDAAMRVGKVSVQFRRWNVAKKAYELATRKAPQSFEGWIELAAVQLAVRQPQEAFGSVQKAVASGGESARRVLRADKRFDPLRGAPAFKELVPPPQPGNIMSFGN